MNNLSAVGHLFFALVFAASSLGGCNPGQEPVVSIISGTRQDGPAAYGLGVLCSSLENLGTRFELVNSPEAARGETLLMVGWSGEENTEASVAEAFVVDRRVIDGKPALTVSGSDERGLMYGLLDLAERIGWSDDKRDPFHKVAPVTEKPAVPMRAISMYTMNRAYWESRFYDEKYWERYMDMLARNRINWVVVIFGYENGGFLAPCYPYFFDVDGFPGIRMDGMTGEMQQRNLAALNRMIEMAHQRGLAFRVGIWDHIYRGGVQDGGIPKEELERQQNYLVRGLDAENLGAYTKAALAKFLREVPGLDGLQLRMHNESGLQRGAEMEAFWREVFQMIRETAPDMSVDLRAKELPESVIQIARDEGLNFIVTTKYWMEQMGLPFHPTHINRENQFDRRHGYADMLRYPPGYRINWRMFSGGTQRILLWGDPEYVRRFARSTLLYDGRGFEVNEPLATKMEAQPHDEKPFSLLNPSYVYYDYEFERYWHFFQVIGRVAYNPDTPGEVWEHEFERRFGSKTGPVVREALHQASRILPMIVAACSPYGTFPTTRGWPEKQRYGTLPQYALAEGSDIQQFASFDEEARILIEGGETAKRLPSGTSGWFLQRHREIERLIGEAEALASGHMEGELGSTLTDLRILSGLALYHSRRIPAAVSYRIFVRTRDPEALEEAITYEGQAIEAWNRIVEAAGDVYASDLKMGVREAEYLGINHHLSGHWKDELGYLKNGMTKLEAMRSSLQETSGTGTAPGYAPAQEVSFREKIHIRHEAVNRVPVHEAIAIRASVEAEAGIRWVRLRYRAVNQHRDYSTLEMTRDPGTDAFQATVPAEEIDPLYDFMYFLEVMDREGHGMIYPDLEQETPYWIVNLERD